MLAPPSQIHKLKLNTQCDGIRSGVFGRWLAHAGGVLMMTLVPFYKRDSRELPHSFCHTRTQGEEGHLWKRKWALKQTLNLPDLDLALPISRTVREINVCCCIYTICGRLLQQTEWTKTTSNGEVGTNRCRHRPPPYVLPCLCVEGTSLSTSTEITPISQWCWQHEHEHSSEKPPAQSGRV